MKKSDNWESLIAERMEAHRESYTPQRIEDARKRNSAEATKRWREKNRERYIAVKRAWEKANPDKVKAYRERNRKNVKRWAEEHPERVRELGRRSDAKRSTSPKRIAWEKAYRQTEAYKERARERDRRRQRTPERRAWEREYRRKRNAALKAAKEAA